MSFQLVGQSLSALVSTSFQHVSACRRCHSLTETVYFASLSFFRLIRSFHDISPDFGFLPIFYFFCIFKIQFSNIFKFFKQVFCAFVHFIFINASKTSVNKYIVAKLFEYFVNKNPFKQIISYSFVFRHPSRFFESRHRME